MTSRKRGMGMAEPGYGHVSERNYGWISRAAARSLVYLYLKGRQLQGVSSFVNGSVKCCLQGVVRVFAVPFRQSILTGFWAAAAN